MIGINTDFIHALSDESAPNAQLLQLTAKLTEEAGELQAAALVRTDCKNASASAEDNLEEEARSRTSCTPSAVRRRQLYRKGRAREA